MKTLFILLLAASAALGADAKSAFDSKDYPVAISQAQEHLQSAPSAEGYYNIGLANEKKGDVVQAALNYERAVLLDPGLRAARNALARLAASKSIPLPPHEWTDEVRAIVHPDTLAFIGFALVWSGAFGLLFATQAARRRAAMNALSAPALLVGAAALVAGWLSDARMMMTIPAAVTSKDGAEVLTAPANNATSVISLPAGTPVDVLSPRGDWAYIDINGGAKGWVQTDRLTPLIPGETF
jgi:hypothetical protein